MKIVIDIPEWKYKSICEGVEASKRCGVVGIDPDIHEAIYSGTPLPKGHGDLIDRSKLIFFRCPNNVKDCPSEYDFTCQNCDFGVTSRFRVDATPVIIPADKEDKDEDSN